MPTALRVHRFPSLQPYLHDREKILHFIYLLQGLADFDQPFWVVRPAKMKIVTMHISQGAKRGDRHHAFAGVCYNLK